MLHDEYEEEHVEEDGQLLLELTGLYPAEHVLLLPQKPFEELLVPDNWLEARRGWGRKNDAMHIPWQYRLRACAHAAAVAASSRRHAAALAALSRSPPGAR